MNFETFVSVAEDVRERMRIKRSEFIVNVHKVHSETEAKEFFAKIFKEFRDATHNCWAYKIGSLKASSDAGEPSGTAGMQILGSVESFKLDRIAVVVTRYFGGVKLGIRGLIDAYSKITSLALTKAKKTKFLVGRRIAVEVDYKDLSKVAYKFKKSGYFYTKSPQFAEKIKLELFVPKNAKIDVLYENLGVDELSEKELFRI